MSDEAGDRRLAEMEQRLAERVDARFQELKSLIISAYPGGDPHGHRLAHEEMIASTQRWSRMKFGVIEKITGGGALAALIFVSHAVWDYIQRVKLK